MSILPVLLCVEDDAAVREFYDRLFSTHGYEVLLAESYSQALELFRQNSVDAVITDYMLPGGNGAQLARKLKLLSPQTPIMMISGSFPPEYEPPEGVDAVLAKGSSIREILERLELLVAAGQTASSLPSYGQIGSIRSSLP